MTKLQLYWSSSSLSWAPAWLRRLACRLGFHYLVLDTRRHGNTVSWDRGDYRCDRKGCSFKLKEGRDGLGA